MESNSSRQKPIVDCEICGEKVMRTKLNNHLRVCQNKDGGGIFECKEPDCPKAFKTKQYLSRHVREVHIEQPIKCPISECGDMMKKSSLSKHMKRVHERVREECPNCSKKITYGNLNQHLLIYTSDGSRPYECEEEGCKSTFRTAQDRSRHMSRVHREKINRPFSDCGTRMKKASLPQHVRLVHDKLRETCTNCDKTVAYGTLNRHLNICMSDGSRPYECEEKGCNSTFRTAQDRSTHISQVHSQPIDCPFPDCDAKIKKASLSIHVRLVHDKMKETCTNCGKELSYGNLTRHLKLCTSDGSRPYECEEEGCKSTFKTGSDRSSHMSRVHREKINRPFRDCDARIKKKTLRRVVHDRIKEECPSFSKKISYDNLNRHIERCNEE